METVTPKLKRIKVLIGYSAHARFCALLADEWIGEIRRTIGQPYVSSPSHAVYSLEGRPVVIAETKHRRYEVFEVLSGVLPVGTIDAEFNAMVKATFGAESEVAA